MKAALVLLAAAATAMAAPVASAQTVSTGSGPAYPARTVRIIVPYAAGGNTDITARAIGAKLTEDFGQQVIVDNRPGGATNIGSELAAKAAPDGYTLFMGGASNAINMSLYAKPPYDTLRDFAPITLCVKGANVLSIHPSLPVKTLKELIALAKARPGQLNYASSGLGSSNQMAGELLKLMAGINLVHVPYKGTGPALTAMLGGEIQVQLIGISSVVPYLKTGRMRALAVSGAKRSAAAPDIPTVAESGVPGYAFDVWYGMLFPAGVPRAIVAKVNAAINNSLRSPALAQRFAAIGLEPSGSTPDAFAAMIRSEMAKWRTVVREAGIRVE